MKKVLFIFALVFTLLLPCFGVTTAFASFNFNFPESVPPIPESFDYDYYLVFDTGYGQNSYSGYVVHGSNSKVYYKNGALYYFPNNEVHMVQCLTGEDWNMNYGKYTNYDSGSNLSLLIYSNYDIYNEDGTELFFQVPQPVLGMEKETLAQVVAQENPLKEILTILPMVIPCWVGFVALRKALRLLATILRTA